MQKPLTKVLSVIMALCLFVTLFPMSVSAVEEPTEEGEVVGERVELIEISPETEMPYATNNSINKFYSSGSDADVGYLFYNQLTIRQKGMYASIYNAGVKEEITLALKVYYVGTGATKYDAAVSIQPELNYDIKTAITAVMEDNPMIFWPSAFDYSYSYTTTGQTADSYTVTIKSVRLTIYFDEDSYSNITDVQQKYTELATAVEDFHVNGFSRYEKVKSIHDSLCDMITYPENQGTNSSPDYGPMAHHPTGALLNGSAVCEGYAEAFKLICDREGIPCITVIGYGNGGGHKWNYVKMDDGLWYLLDATWNDQETYTHYGYYLIGSIFDGGEHVNSGIMFQDSMILQYPVLATESYSYTVPTNDTPDVAFNNTNCVLYVDKGIDTLNELFNYIGYYDGYSISYANSSIVTGQEISITNTKTNLSKTYLVAIRGDIDATNAVNNADYNVLTQVCATKYKVDDGTAEFYAGDINQDGAIDGFDAIAHDLYTDGTLVFD